MMTFAWVVVGIVGVMVSLFVLGWANAMRASMVRNRKLDELVRPALAAVQENLPSARDVVAQVAEIPVARNHLFTVLKEAGKVEFFPASCRTVEKVAESDLARWLMHPNELGAAPAEMELVQRIPIREQDKSGNVFFFRFRPDDSHWAAKSGWMAGMAGPYWESDELQDFASGTFSELIPFDKMTVEQHVALLRKKLAQKGLVVLS